MVKLIYHGHSCWEIDDGDHRTLIDPFLTGNENADAGPESFGKLDGIILTHSHGDHLGDTIAIAKKSGALVVANFEIHNWLTAKKIKSHPLHIGGGHQFDFGHIKLTIAHHGSSGPDGEYLGAPAGVLFTIGGKKIYHAGDTALCYDMKLLDEMYGPVDVAMFPIGDNFTMDIRDAVKATEFVNAKMNIPMHYNTFPVIEADPEEFKQRVEAIGRKACVLKPGESIEV